MANFKLFKEILTEVDKKGNRAYSQGRVYLLWSIIAYYITIGFMSFKSLRPDININIDTLKIIIDALQWALGLFGGYVFGGKGLDVVKNIFGKNQPEKTSEEVQP